MDRLTLRLSPDLIRRFDAAAVHQGGRSRLLRRLMEEAAFGVAPEGEAGSFKPLSDKLTLRLRAEDLAELEAEARRTGLSRTQWATALIRRRLHGRPQLTPSEATAVIEARRALRRIGVNLNQLVRGLNTAAAKGLVVDVEMARLAAFEGEITVWVDALGQAFVGNLAYWEVRS